MTAIPMFAATVSPSETPSVGSSESAATLSAPLDAAARLGLEAAAMTLMANGMVGTAEPLFARLAAQSRHVDPWRAREALARETFRADALAREASVPGFVPVPSAQRTHDGTPRFVLLVDEARIASAEGAARFTSELTGQGVDAELRHFLDAALDDSNGFIDWTPDEGYAVLSAATAPSGAACVVARTDDAHHEGIERSIARVQTTPAVTLHASGAITLDEMVTGLDAPMVHVRAGRAADVPSVMATAREAVHAGRIASVLWSVAPNGGLQGTSEHVAATVLSVLGFSHFTVVDGPDGAELSMLDGTPSGHALVVSLSPAYLASQAG